LPRNQSERFPQLVRTRKLCHAGASDRTPRDILNLFRIGVAQWQLELLAPRGLIAPIRPHTKDFESLHQAEHAFDDFPVSFTYGADCDEGWASDGP